MRDKSVKRTRKRRQKVWSELNTNLRRFSPRHLTLSFVSCSGDCL